MENNLSEVPVSSAERAFLAGLLRERASERMASRRWDTRAVLVIYGLFATVVVLRLGAANTYLVLSMGAVGLLAFWLSGWLRWKRQEKRLLQEELDRPLSVVSNAPVAVPAVVAVAADSPLSQRELQVLSMIAGGMTNKEIAYTLDLSPHTVKTHRSHIFAKLDVRDRTSAVLVAVSRGWIQANPRGLVEK